MKNEMTIVRKFKAAINKKYGRVWRYLRLTPTRARVQFVNGSIDDIYNNKDGSLSRDHVGNAEIYGGVFGKDKE